MKSLFKIAYFIENFRGGNLSFDHTIFSAIGALGPGIKALSLEFVIATSTDKSCHILEHRDFIYKLYAKKSWIFGILKMRSILGCPETLFRSIPEIR